MKTNTPVPRPRTLARPFAASLFGDLDALFDEFWRVGAPAERPPAPGAAAPRMDWLDDEQEIRIRAEMPGLEENDISVSLEDGVLTIEGERSEEREEGEVARHVETWRGTYRRAIALPEEVDEDAVRADYRNGILTVTLPKRAPEARTIPVSAS